jgi:UDPglucose 6-dehydrogenase
MARPIVVDLRNVYRPDDVAKHGFLYRGLGRVLQTSGGALQPHPTRIAAE